MSGRQAHGRPLLQQPGSRKKNIQRGGPSRPARPVRAKTGRVDVLALAEKQVGETKSKGVRLRDLDIERDPSKRRRGNEEDEEEDEADDGGRDGGVSKRRRRNEEEGAGDEERADDSDNEMQSDSDGNEWHVGVDSNDDDSEIDSDEAFGESDDEMFDGYAFGRSSSASKSKKKKRSKGGDESEEFDEPDDLGDDEDSLGEDAIDLAQALDQVSSDSDSEEAAASKKKPKKAGGRKVGDSDAGSSVDSGSIDSEDEEEEDDSNSESSVLSDEEEEEDEEEDDSDASDASDESTFEELKSMASAFAGKSKSDEVAAGSGAGQNKVSLSDLGLFGVKDAQMKKSLKLLAREEKGESGPSKKLDVPLARIHQERMHREAAAEKTHETLGRWVDTVKHNRRAEHLSFPVAGALEGTGLDSMELRPISQKTAQTELEKTILSIMQESGLEPSGGSSKKKKGGVNGDGGGSEEKEKLSAEELKQLVSQRRHQREVQSREQARARRIKKIKSKAYRRIHRRAKAKNDAAAAELEEGSDVDSEAEREAQHRRRAMERMGSRHRESKWVKQAKNTGRAAWDEDFRSGLVDMARRDEELRQRVAKRGSDDEKEQGNSDSSSDEDEDEDDEAFLERTRAELEKAGKEADKGPQSALMNIGFMQRAELARKKANDEAVAEIMRDLDVKDDSGEEDAKAGDEDGEDGAWTTVGRRTYGVAKAGKPTKTAAKRKVEKVKTAEEAEKAEKAEKGTEANSWFREDTMATSAKGDTWSSSKEPESGGRQAKTEAAGKRAKAREVVTLGNGLENMLERTSEKEAKQPKQPKKQPKKETTATTADDSDTSSSGSSSSSSDEDENEDEDSARFGKAGVRGRGSKPALLNLRVLESDLLRQALGDDDAEAEFEREKQRVATEEAEAAAAEAQGGSRKRGADFLPGWGSWSGEGISKRSAKRDQNRLETKTAASKDKKPKPVARRDDKLERVIISERRVQKNAKYLASQLPHQFETKNQYERSLRLPVGPEWGTKTAFQDSIKPRLLAKQGVVLPMARPLV
ncbi:small nucleolar ribonucleoprotein complex subunit putatrive [Grosmannia clavigera kw1407]|uniref:Small nucleolar ribonucleoprotein complex subunit putatrive n=1 Tax=Grosmannia clavigera (strain kw1407 / UAMH 11150) TaxID=655863 RepID=F0XHN1_GROCL|nr:small nucleolar ribonucleoprotein complex subunit putatrive [Grosmannia clavigera kw1407]EFX03114.1 small nucleolar ribonucleoprotein complex subunit putatrive [Grosmannia clavigera kw1407]